MISSADLASPSELRQYKLIGRILEVSEETGHRQVPTESLYRGGHLLNADERAMDADLAAFKARGWVDYFASVAGIDEVVLKQPGADAGEAFEKFRTNPRNRVPAARDALVQWLYDEYLDGNSYPVINRFSESAFENFYGVPFTWPEVIRACTWLHSEGFIAGTRTNAGVVPRPSITPKGIRFVEGRASVNDQHNGGVTTVTNNHLKVEGSSGVNVALNSQNVNQSNSVTIEQIEQTTKFIGSARSLVPALGLDGDQQERALQVIGELEVESTSTAPNQGRLKQLMGKVLEIVVTGTATGVADALVAMGNGVIGSLG
ncbi:hypothetical protein [Arthrobacter sp. HY1533]|uniref:hypothetical protein n=1 Tax=Arthrobacter sp. HY1533 TaxID=2970919 RepID=UPI0022B9D6D5|nr:hypothetical protein [Arthrobacter sp. HY1533]